MTNKQMIEKNKHTLTLERYSSLDKSMLSSRTIDYLNTFLGTPLATPEYVVGLDIKHLSYLDNFLYLVFFGCGFSVEQKKLLVSECADYAFGKGVYVDSFFKQAVYFNEQVKRATNFECEHVNYYGYGLLSLTQMLDSAFPFVQLFEHVIDCAKCGYYPFHPVDYKNLFTNKE